jgi:hypothetical protein
VFDRKLPLPKVRSVRASEPETQGHQAGIFSSLSTVSGVVERGLKCFDLAALKRARNMGLVFAAPQSPKMAKIVTVLRIFITPY